jgi:hypothetical protein
LENEITKNKNMNLKIKLLIVAASLINPADLIKTNPVYAADYHCGEVYQATADNNCLCENDEPLGGMYHCCGWLHGTSCLSENPKPAPEEIEETEDEPLELINPELDPADAETLKKLNPLNIGESTQKAVFLPDGQFSLAGFINQAINFIFPLAGLILFVMLVWGGFEMLTSAASKKGLDAGKQRITAAIIGFLLLFASYWIIQIVEAITGVVILG